MEETFLVFLYFLSIESVSGSIGYDIAEATDGGSQHYEDSNTYTCL